MTAESYSAGIARLGAAELDGEDIEGEIARFTKIMRSEPANIRAAINEWIEDQR